MFSSIRLRGSKGSILWGYHAAADVATWTISHNQDKREWRLVATLRRMDAFQLRQRPLLFSAPQPGGFWCFPLIDLEVGNAVIRAKLGPPEGGTIRAK